MEGYVNPNAQQQQQQQQFGLDPNASYGGGQLAVQPSQPGGQQQQPPPYDIEAAVLGRALMADFLRASRTYDILPESSKVVVFDVAVPVKLAFYALVEHDTMCAPLWDAGRGGYAGLLTSSDICDIMRIFYTPGTAASALSELTIAAWREYACSHEGLRRGLTSPQLYASPEQLESALSAAAGGAESSLSSSGGPNGASSGVSGQGARRSASSGGKSGGKRRAGGGIVGNKRRRPVSSGNSTNSNSGAANGADGNMSNDDAATIEELDEEEDEDEEDDYSSDDDDRGLDTEDDDLGLDGPPSASAAPGVTKPQRASSRHSRASSSSSSKGVVSPRLGDVEMTSSGTGPARQRSTSTGGGAGAVTALTSPSTPSGPGRGSRSDSQGSAALSPASMKDNSSSSNNHVFSVQAQPLTAASRSSSGSSTGAGRLAVLSLDQQQPAASTTSGASSSEQQGNGAHQQPLGSAGSSTTSGPSSASVGAPDVAVSSSGSTSISFSASTTTVGPGPGPHQLSANPDARSSTTATSGWHGGRGGRGAKGGRDTNGSAIHPSLARKQRAARRPPPRLVSIHPEDDLLTVSKKLRSFNIHHMPVHDPDTDAVIGVLSHRSLMSHVISKFTDTSRVFDQPLWCLGVGSFSDIVVVPESASVISVLHVLAERQISSVPIVNADTGALVDVYSRDDVSFLANDPTLVVLDAPVGDVKRAQVQMTGVVSPLLTCSRADTLHHALELFAAAGGRAERVICVDAARRVTGVVSLSDIFAYFARADDDPQAESAMPASWQQGLQQQQGMTSSSSGIFFGGGQPPPATNAVGSSSGDAMMGENG